MKRAARFAVGSVVYDKRRRTWHLYTYENGKRHSKLIGRKCDLPNRSAARMAAAKMQHPLEPAPQPECGASTVQELVTAYLQEKRLRGKIRDAPTRNGCAVTFCRSGATNKLQICSHARSRGGWNPSRCLPRAGFTFVECLVASGTTACGAATCRRSEIPCP
jgi:hypothetical protein